MTTMTPLMGGLRTTPRATPACSCVPVITLETPEPLPRIVAEQLLHLTSFADPDSAADEYERYVPIALLVVALEPAATSPFMDF